MSDATFDIQELVAQSGVPRRTVYFYVQQGLLPPPQGAGLAAHYTEDHLLRLRLIPLLRGQGLRLDEIRARFQQMSPEEMRHMATALLERRASLRALIESAPDAIVISPQRQCRVGEFKGKHGKLTAAQIESGAGVLWPVWQSLQDVLDTFELRECR